MSSFVFDDTSKDLTMLIMRLLIEMLDKTNKLVKIFRMVEEKFRLSEIWSRKLTLIGWRSTDSNQYDFSTSTDIGALIVGDIGEYESSRDIVITNRTKALQRITKLHLSYMSLQYPLLFSYGEYGYRIDLQCTATTANKKTLTSQISMRAFYCYQLQKRCNQGNTLI